jgi:hypothetical protein
VFAHNGCVKASSVHAAAGDAVDIRALFGIELREVTDALRNFVIGARGVAADAETADALPIRPRRISGGLQLGGPISFRVRKDLM